MNGPAGLAYGAPRVTEVLLFFIPIGLFGLAEALLEARVLPAPIALH